jgi:predicted dehydrogenase
VDPLRIGLIGAGENTRRRHIPGFQSQADVDIVCVANRTVASAQRVAREFGIPRVYTHWREVIADSEVDAVCIGTWPYLHAPATCAALAAGKHVLCEARMAMNCDEARAMLAAQQQSDRVAMLVPSPLGLRGDAVMRELIGGGYLGSVREIYVRGFASTYADRHAPLHWRQRGELSGVNILTLGILYETVCRWFGQAESVVAQTALFTPRRVDPESGLLADVDIPDSVSVLARMASGAQCVFHLSGAVYHGGSPRVEAHGSHGTLHYDLASDAISGASAPETYLAPIDIPPQRAGGWNVEADFVAAIREGRPIRFTTFRDGLRYMQFTEAVRRSAATGQRVSLDTV